MSNSKLERTFYPKLYRMCIYENAKPAYSASRLRKLREGKPLTTKEALEMPIAALEALDLRNLPMDSCHKDHFIGEIVDNWYDRAANKAWATFRLFNDCREGIIARSMLEKGAMRGASLTHEESDVTMSDGARAVLIDPKRVALCFEGARKGTWVETGSPEPMETEAEDKEATNLYTVSASSSAIQGRLSTSAIREIQASSTCISERTAFTCDGSCFTHATRLVMASNNETPVSSGGPPPAASAAPAPVATPTPPSSGGDDSSRRVEAGLNSFSNLSGTPLSSLAAGAQTNSRDRISSFINPSIDAAMSSSGAAQQQQPPPQQQKQQQRHPEDDRRQTPPPPSAAPRPLRTDEERRRRAQENEEYRSRRDEAHATAPPQQQQHSEQSSRAPAPTPAKEPAADSSAPMNTEDIMKNKYIPVAVKRHLMSILEDREAQIERLQKKTEFEADTLADWVKNMGTELSTQQMQQLRRDPHSAETKTMIREAMALSRTPAPAPPPPEDEDDGMDPEMRERYRAFQRFKEKRVGGGSSAPPPQRQAPPPTYAHPPAPQRAWSGKEEAREPPSRARAAPRGRSSRAEPDSGPLLSGPMIRLVPASNVAMQVERQWCKDNDRKQPRREEIDTYRIHVGLEDLLRQSKQKGALLRPPRVQFGKDIVERIFVAR